MKDFLIAIIAIIIFIAVILIADTISNIITMDFIMKWSYLTLGFCIIYFLKEGV